VKQLLVVVRLVTVESIAMGIITVNSLTEVVTLATIDTSFEEGNQTELEVILS
jgi:hypothetical protein